MKILTVMGARPQFIKAAVISRELRGRNGMQEILVHTGQHFDRNMSDVFFEELEIPPPDYHLGIGGGTHGQNTGRMIEAVEKVLLDEKPDWVLVYGDTDSTLAGGLAAVKLHIPLAHVEAGLRSFNRKMPEELNRILTDHSADLLFAPTEAAVRNLSKENIQGEKVCNVGDVLYDASIYYGEKAEKSSNILKKLNLDSKKYILATLHRQENVDDRIRFRNILDGFALSQKSIILPLHPRTRKKILEFGLDMPKSVQTIDPVGFLDMVMLEKHACLIATDSGGVQKEAYFHSVPCITLRDETEWIELVESGWNKLAGSSSDKFIAAVEEMHEGYSPGPRISYYGYGNSSARIVDALVQYDLQILHGKDF